MKKKAQMQMFETIGVLFVFFLLLAFALIFYAGFQKDKSQGQLSDKTEQELVTTAQIIQSLPELKCIEQGSITENCYDLLSIEILSRLLKESNPNGYLNPNNPISRLYFLELFKNSNITISIYDEKNENFTTHTLYYHNEYPNNNARPSFVPITIKDSRDGEFYFGVLYLTVFTEN